MKNSSPDLILQAIVKGMSILMVKKILRNGSPCEKCLQAEEILRKRNFWNFIDTVVIADESDTDSEGMKLSAEKKIEQAPFFIVKNQDGEERIYTKVFEFIKKELEELSPSGDKQGEHNSFPRIDEWNERFVRLSPAKILAEVQGLFGSRITLAFSGAEDVVLIDMASKNNLPFCVFCLDTGRLPTQTYNFLDTVRNHYGITIDIHTPSPKLLEPYLGENGMNSFFRDGHKECCRIRKVEPLGRALKGRSAWVTGLRKDQSPSTRANLLHAEYDEGHLNEEGKPLLKINPVLDWSSRLVWDYIRDNNVPYNPLHDEGYMSIGCKPCTRPSRPGEHERAARWWWEEKTTRECGLHIS